MVAEAPASRWNPLFIYGGVGLGKTHLLQAIGHEIHRQHPDWVITFVTCEGFVTDFIGSMMNQKRQSGTNLMEEFRARYRERARRAARRRHSVPVEQGQLAGRVLSHVQRAPLRAQADRAHVGQAAGGAAGRRGSAAQPVHLGPHRRGRDARPRDARGDPQAQGGVRAGHPARRRRALCRGAREDQRARARGSAAADRGARVVPGAGDHARRGARRAAKAPRAIRQPASRSRASSARSPPTSTSSCTTSRGRSAIARSRTRA